MVRCCLIVITLFLSGCATLKEKGFDPYGSISLGSQINRHTDYFLRTDTWDNQCPKNVKVNAGVGIYLPVPDKWYLPDKVGIHHESFLLCGWPFNDDPEITSYDFRITKEIGGR